MGDSPSDQSPIVSISERMAFPVTDAGHDCAAQENDVRHRRMSGKSSLRLHLHTRNSYGGASSTPSRRTSDVPSTPRMSSSPAYAFPTMKYSPRRSETNVGELDTETTRPGVPRSASLYSISRMSFASQVSQLVSVQLPNAESLSTKILSLESSSAAASLLTDAAEQITAWTRKASDVLGDLEAADDVDWAAAGGRDGMEDIEHAIARFEVLVKVYIISVEQLRARKDASSLPVLDHAEAVAQMEAVVKEWQKIKDVSQGVKEQVEIALEWKELWDTVLGEIGQELESLSKLVFEMEERRHQFDGPAAWVDSPKRVNIDELKSIVEEKPAGRRDAANPRFSLPPPFSPTSPKRPPPSNDEKEDSNLLELFARMQPLRASLDFLPMRLSVFHCRGNPVFPSACLDLESRRDLFEEQWRRLEADAEGLRRELSEDRWVLVFRNAARQALKMCESVERSHDKLRGSLDAGAGARQTDSPLVARMIESYEAKKTHYIPAVERVLAIIDRGVLDRLTVNGEILRLQSEMRRRWSCLQLSVRDLDSSLEQLNTSSRNQQLRDSISTILSTERSMTSSVFDTPISSAASSVVLESRGSSFHDSITPLPTTKQRSIAKPSPSWTSSHPQTSPVARQKVPSSNSSRSFSSPLPRVAEQYAPAPKAIFRDFHSPVDKPRWNTSTVVNGSPRVDSPRSASAQYHKSLPSQQTATPRPKASRMAYPSPLNPDHVSAAAEFPSTPSGRTPSARTPLSNPLPRASSTLAHRTVSSDAKVSGQRPRTPSSSTLVQRSATPTSGHKTSFFTASALSGGGQDVEIRPAPRSASWLSRSPRTHDLANGIRSGVNARPGSRAGGGRESRIGSASHTVEGKAPMRF